MQKLLDAYQQSLVGVLGIGQGRTHYWRISFPCRAFFNTLVPFSVNNVGILIRTFRHICMYIEHLIQPNLNGLL